MANECQQPQVQERMRCMSGHNAITKLDEDGFRSKFEQQVQKLITQNLLMAGQLLKYYLEELTVVHFSEWPRD